MQWRLDFGVDALVECFDVQGTARDTPAHGELRQILAAENVAAKVYVRGYDANGRALMYMTPARENTNHELNNMRHLVFNLEKAIQCTKHKSMQVQTSKWNRTTVQDEKGVMSSSNVSSTSSSSSSSSGASVPPPQPQLLLPLEKINLLIDYDGFKLKNAPPMSTTKYTLEILQKHYPERMQHAYLLNPPFVFRAFWALIKAFVDPITKAKIVFCTMPSHLTSNVTDLHKLEPRAYGSNAGIQEFDSHEYLRLLFHMSFNEE